jgi:hypothetical protein
MQFPSLYARAGGVAKIGGNLGRGLPSFDRAKKGRGRDRSGDSGYLEMCLHSTILCSTFTTVRSHGNHSKNLALRPNFSEDGAIWRLSGKWKRVLLYSPEPRQIDVSRFEKRPATLSRAYDRKDRYIIQSVLR